MIRSRFRALAFLATLLLVLPMIASAGVVIAQDATPTASEPSAQPLAEAMPADVQAFVSTDFDLESDLADQAGAGLLLGGLEACHPRAVAAGQWSLKQITRRHSFVGGFLSVPNR